jgi:hypothetical protein
MKNLLPLLISLLLPAAALASGFEGRVTMKMTGPKGAPPAMTFSLKDGFSRIDMSGSEGRNAAVIFNSAKQEMTILMLDQKMYMTQAIPTPAAAAASAGVDGGTAGSSVEVTTTKEKILGYDCVKYVAQTKDGTSEIWVTDQLGAFLGFGGGAAMGGGRRGGGAPAAQGWEQALAGKGVFPLRVVTTAGGKETFRLEATAVEKTPLPDTAFSAPADFHNLSDMMRGMGMPGGIPGLPGGMKMPGGE